MATTTGDFGAETAGPAPVVGGTEGLPWAAPESAVLRSADAAGTAKDGAAKADPVGVAFASPPAALEAPLKTGRMAGAPAFDVGVAGDSAAPETPGTKAAD